MNQHSLLTEKIPAQIGLTIFVTISVLFFIFFIWNFQKTQREVISLQAYSPLSVKKKPFLGIENPIKETITIVAEEDLLDFERKSFWSEKDFTKILGSKEEFREKETDSFKNNILKESGGKIKVTDLKLDVNEKEKFTILSCYLKGVRGEKNSYDFSWFLKNFPFDFSQFKKQDDKLIFIGEIEETKIEIYIEFPFLIEASKDKVWQTQ